MGLIKREKTFSIFADEKVQVRDYETLLKAIHADSTEERRLASIELAGHPQAANILAEQLMLEPSLIVRKSILSSLATIASADAIAGLINCLRSEDVAMRNEAIEAMSLMTNHVTPLMSRLLVDPDPDVRIYSVNILGSLKDPNVEQWLIQVISNDDHINVCATAVDLLVEIGTTNSIEPLKKLKDKFMQHPYITFVSDLALKRIRETK